MRCVTYVNEKTHTWMRRHIHECAASHAWMRCDTYMNAKNETCHLHKRVISRKHQYDVFVGVKILYIFMYEQVMLNMNQSNHTYKWIMSHIWMNHGIYDSVMSHTWISKPRLRSDARVLLRECYIGLFLNKWKLGEPSVYLKPVEQTLFSATVPI